MSHYTFSWFTKRKAPVLKRRPWWNVFGRDTIELREQWERIEICNIPEREAMLLKDASAGHWDSPLGTLLVRMMSNPLSIQLEQYGASSAYMPTGGPILDHGAYQVEMPRAPQSAVAALTPNESPLGWIVFCHADPEGYDYRIFADEHEANSVAGEDERHGEPIPLYRASAFMVRVQEANAADSGAKPG